MRFALRSLRRRPAFALAAVLTVALGVGANTALFSVIYTVLIAPLAFREPARLVQLWETHPALPQLQVTSPDFRDWREQARSFEQISAYTFSAMNTGTLLGQGEPEIVHATMAGSDLFSTMGMGIVVGRAFDETEERRKEKVAVISEALWRRKFGADASAVGRQVRIDGQSFRVTGVIAQRQAYPEWADLWIPLSLMEAELQERRKYHPLEVIARLKPGVTAEQAQSEMQTIARKLSEAHSDTNATVGAYVTPLAREMTRAVRPSLLLAWAAVALVLLMACANLAHLFLARMIERRQEMSVREALGAGRWSLARLILTEGIVVAAVGGAAGVAWAVWMQKVMIELAAKQIPRVEWTGFGAPVWLFAVGISLAAGVLLAVPACWQVTARRKALPESRRSVARGRSRLGGVLVAGEVALAVLVLAGVALLTRNFAALLQEDPGFRAERVWAVPNLPLRGDWDKAAAFFETRLRPALLGIPGVDEVAAVNSAPMSLGATEHSRFATRFGVEGRTFDAGSYPVTQSRWVTPEYFRALGIPLKLGRTLTEQDRGKPVVLVNEALARRFFAGGDAVGKRLILGVMDPKSNANEIVGVVGDVRELGLDREVEPVMYGAATGPVMTVVVKTAGERPGLAAAIRDAIHGVDAEIAVTKIAPLAQNVSESLARRRFALVLLAVFGGMAALLTAAGVYGLLAQSVNARVRELGVRAAVGAAPGELVAMILREALAITAPGLLAGAALSLAFGRVMQSFVYQVSATDPLSVASAGAFLVALTLASAWLPARRAARVDPAVALRAD